MGDDRPYTAEELAQMERDQQDPEFVAWLAAMDEDLRVFFEQDVPDMPENPWSEEGLRHAEQAAVSFFWAHDLDWPEREVRFARYLGEVFTRSFEGSWKWIDVRGDGKAPVVRRPSMPNYFEVANQVRAAVSERSGETWAELFRNTRRFHDAWVAAGRLAPQDWEDYRVKQDMKRLGVSDDDD
ncbi:hypothetical protein [Luteipulveratus mongoliensis]|uniref:Uncharacterized protein n=1 Tax=Luteipulveratus mongoliensis TaxID=571913 RepID=A0A0K1JDI3_9MICO|nr:hypothetical protein [Luteipulveratus mongoliensis]AKU14754.1 hypothetical protein VV02_00800 [Luteipulveratus mongoliensis]